MNRRYGNIPGDTIQLFLPLNLNHPAVLRLQSAGVAMCGISETTPGFHILRQAPEFLLAMFVTGGRGRMDISGRKVELRRGDFVLAPPGCRQEYFQTGQRRWNFFWFHLEPDNPWLKSPIKEMVLGRCNNMRFLQDAMLGLFAEVIFTLQAVPDEARRLLRFYEDSLPLEETLNAFRLKIAQFPFYSNELAELYGGIIVAYLKREVKSLLQQLDEDEYRNRLEKLWDILAGRLEHSWNLPEMAALVNMSVPSLIRHARAAYHATPGQILGRMRLKHAAELLLSSRMPVAMVALRTGYENPTSFAAAFKREFRYSPREYRKRNQQQLQ
mgnify:CR=1 FL=1